LLLLLGEDVVEEVNGHRAATLAYGTAKPSGLDALLLPMPALDSLMPAASGTRHGYSSR
jgi:hypothetical protein